MAPKDTARKGVVRKLFRGLLSALVTGRQLAEKSVAHPEEDAAHAADLATAYLAEPLPAALPPPSPRQPRQYFNVREGWSEPEPRSIPQPTYVPAGMAMGIVLVSLGIVTRWYFDAIGAVIILIAVYHWITELLGEDNHEMD